MHQSKTGPRAALIDLLTPVVDGAGADLEDVTVSRAGSRSVVRVVVDRDGGLDLDAVADVSHAVSAALDEAEDLLRGSFVLEVSTPGVDRPLTEPRHWRRATGRLVKVSRRSGGGLLGRVVAAGDLRVVLADPATGTSTEISYDEVARAVVQVEFAAVSSAADKADEADEADPELDALEASS